MAEQLLSGLKVVECGNMVSAAYAGKLLADFGADVVKVEVPDGDLRSGLYRAWVFLLRFVAPIGVGVILLQSLGLV